MPDDRLEEYRAKRRAAATPEPFGGARGPRPHLFVVQQHAATSLHWDLRLEWKGVLLSWAVPKGPSADPEVKRLAVRTEDHPLAYADFEGVIPEGNYGAGEVIVWDLGSYVPLEEMAKGLDKGKLLFELRGAKLGGTWTLFRTKRGEGREWLLVKKPDAWADGKPFDESSVLSGRTVGELKEGGGDARAKRMREQLAELKAPRRAVDAARARPMLAETEERAFSSPDWVYELKIDGFRLLCGARQGEARLFYRSGREATRLYPEVARTVRALPYASLLLDTEIAVLDAQGHPDFQRLQQRAQLARTADIERASVEMPVVCYAFDLLAIDGHDLRPLPLLDRKRLLREVLPRCGTLRYVDHVPERGEALLAEVAARGLEGIVAKRADAPYRAGRSPAWRKLRVDRTEDFVVVGYTAPRGGRAGFGALHLAAYEGGELTYAGRVGTGFGDRELKALKERLDALRVEAPPCSGPVPRTRGHTWVRPELVCEVRFKERTADGLLRQPAFVRLRDDKPPAECQAPEPRREPDPAPAPPATRGEVEITNPEKVFWPGAGYTKADLVAYYRGIAPWLLPYLRDRPVVLTRYPDGIEGKSFFQKDAPAWVPAWLRTERIWSEQTKREIDYFLCDDAESLAFLANLGTIPLHIWSSRVTDLQRPDWCILDLDPKGAPFRDVVAVARAIHRLCRKVELPCFVKTSGSTGLHVLLPLGGQCTYEQSRALGELVARLVERELPEIATTARAMSKREGRVYLDYLQNGHGRLLAAPYSVRPLPGAPVSTPLHWREVNGKLSLDAFTIRTVPARVKRMRKDPLLAVLDTRPDLVAVLGRLAALA